ncbi:MAG: PQQ-dependent sugar dehydrogenase [Paludibacter sp.]|nr:PQQ-dependent sugar dehydrogenase [Paludibacter sp.]
MKTNRMILILVSILLSLTVFSFVTNQQNTPTPVSESTRALYLKYCAGCHGEKLERFAARQWVFGSSLKEVSATIKFGRPAIGMPAYAKAMDDEQIAAMANYMIREVAKVPAIIPSSFDDKSIIKSENFSFVLQEVVGKNLKIPWGMAFLPNKDLLVTEKSGKMYLVSKDVMTPVEGVPPITVKGQGGLMDVVLHPKFSTNHLIYISYVDGESPTLLNTSIARAELRDGRLVNLKKIFHALPNTNSGIQFGCRMVFDKNGYLFFSVGDHGPKENAQDLTNSNGKIHRVFDDGRIPPDNPFVKTPHAVASIWSYGHRNPEGMYYEKQTDLIWSNEHGPKGGDELNIIKKGKNYGWPVVTFGVDYDGTIISPDTAKTGMEPPVFYWIPSIAPSSLTRVTSSLYKGWKGDFLSGSLSFEYLDRLIMKDNKVIGREKLLQKIGRVRNVVEGPDGYIYIAVERTGKIYKLVPVGK